MQCRSSCPATASTTWPGAGPRRPTAPRSGCPAAARGGSRRGPDRAGCRSGTWRRAPTGPDAGSARDAARRPARTGECGHPRRPSRGRGDGHEPELANEPHLIPVRAVPGDPLAVGLEHGDEQDRRVLAGRRDFPGRAGERAAVRPRIGALEGGRLPGPVDGRDGELRVGEAELIALEELPDLGRSLDRAGGRPELDVVAQQAHRRLQVPGSEGLKPSLAELNRIGHLRSTSFVSNLAKPRTEPRADATSHVIPTIVRAPARRGSVFPPGPRARSPASARGGPGRWPPAEGRPDGSPAAGRNGARGGCRWL